MQIKRAKTSFRCGRNNKGYRGASEGELFPESHELVKLYPDMFEDVEEDVRRRHPDLMVERATAAPAERRVFSKPPGRPPKSSSSSKSSGSTPEKSEDDE